VGYFKQGGLFSIGQKLAVHKASKLASRKVSQPARQPASKRQANKRAIQQAKRPATDSHPASQGLLASQPANKPASKNIQVFTICSLGALCNAECGA